MRKNKLITCVHLGVLLVMMILTGCDKFRQQAATDNLPSVPEKCRTLSDQHKRALIIAYSSSEVSQMQIARAANELTKCLEDEGWSEAQAKGLLKQNEAAAKAETEKTPQDAPIYR